GEDDVEGRLLLGSGPVSACGDGAWCGDGDGSGGRDPPLVLDLLLQLDEVENGHLPELLEHLVHAASGHPYASSSSVAAGASASSPAGVSSSAAASGPSAQRALLRLCSPPRAPPAPAEYLALPQRRQQLRPFH